MTLGRLPPLRICRLETSAVLVPRRRSCPRPSTEKMDVIGDVVGCAYPWCLRNNQRSCRVGAGDCAREVGANVLDVRVLLSGGCGVRNTHGWFTVVAAGTERVLRLLESLAAFVGSGGMNVYHSWEPRVL